VPIAVPTELDEVLTHLRADPNALLLQGGTDLMVEINMQHRQAPPAVIALRRARGSTIRTMAITRAG
jgi:xanthine dehydrogenase iron-sulfur cluster and FAD-binding subunit A